jgi:hypothetical protein
MNLKLELANSHSYVQGTVRVVFGQTVIFADTVTLSTDAGRRAFVADLANHLAQVFGDDEYPFTVDVLLPLLEAQDIEQQLLDLLEQAQQATTMRPKHK